MASAELNAQAEPAAPVLVKVSSVPRLDGRLPLVPAERLRNSPSRADGISAQEETRLRSTACSFIARAGKELQFKQLAIATACVYFHTFFVRFSFKAYDRFEIAAVCLFLAGKVEEQRRKVKDVAEICLMVRTGRRRGPTDPNVLKTVCDSILDRELLLLSVVEFQFHPAHPYQYCMMVLKRIFQKLDEQDKLSPDSESLSKIVQKEIAQYAWLMINDSLKTTLCLQYKPEPVALACIDAAVRIMNLDRDKPIMLRSDWFTEYVVSATAEQCFDIWCVLLEVVELESAGHTGDSQVLWEKFRKVVSSARQQEPEQEHRISEDNGLCEDSKDQADTAEASDVNDDAAASNPVTNEPNARNPESDTTLRDQDLPVVGADDGAKPPLEEPSCKKIRTG